MLDAVRNRRSIRRYEDRPVDPETIELLEEAVLRAPTSRNLRSWYFVFITDPELLQALAHARPAYTEWIGRAPLGVIVCAEPSVSDCWIEDASIAAATLQLSATELGLGSCWMQVRARDHEDGRPAEEYVREVLGLSQKLSVLCMVSVGYAAEDKAPKDRESLLWEKTEVRASAS